MKLEEELELGRRIQQGDDEARNRLIEANIDMVKSLWKPYERPGWGKDEIMQDGYLGMLKAADSYDPSLGLKFSTFATYAIKDAMKHGMLNQCHTICLTYDMVKRHTKLKKFKERFFHKHGVEPTSKEVEDAIGFDEKAQKHIVQSCTPILGTSPIEDEIVDDLEDGFEVDLTPLSRVREVVNKMPHNQHQVIVRSFGLHQGQPETNEEIGRILGCKKEVVQRLKAAAIDHFKALMTV